MMDLVHIRFDDRCRSKHLFSINPTHTCDLKVKAIDLEILYYKCVKACIFKTLRWIWFIFGMMIDKGPKINSAIVHPGHMTKMAAVTIYDKKLKTCISRTKRLMTLKLGF